MMESLEKQVAKTETKASCQCQDCQAACDHKPGWFAPGEAEQVAQFFNMSLSQLFKTYLAVDWWGKGDSTIHLLSPAAVGNTPGQLFPHDPRGRCVFFQDDGQCMIHPVKPMECRETFHHEQPELHHQVAVLWDTPDLQRKMEELIMVVQERVNKVWSTYDERDA